MDLLSHASLDKLSSGISFAQIVEALKREDSENGPDYPRSVHAAEGMHHGGQLYPSCEGRREFHEEPLRAALGPHR